MGKQKIIFLHSISPRSGHNFIADIIRLCVECETPIGERSEIPLAIFLNKYKLFFKEVYGSDGVEEYFNDLFTNELREKVLKNKKSNFLIKNTSIEGVNVLKEKFPFDIHLITIRNPEDILKSIFKGMKFKSDIKSQIKKILLPTGIYHYIYSKKFSNNIVKHLNFKFDDFLILRYEDIVNKDRTTLTSIINELEVKKTISKLEKELGKLKIINTSFFKEETNTTNIWEGTNDKSKFKPINRNYLNPIQAFLVKQGTKELSKKLGYKY